MTCAPSCLAIWMAAEPTPLAAHGKTQSPARTRMVVSMCMAVLPAGVSAAEVVKSIRAEFPPKARGHNDLFRKTTIA